VDQGIPVKRTIVAGVLLLAGVAGAAAADMPVPQGAPVPPPIYRPAFYDWSGVYVGVNGGYGFGQSAWTDFGATTGNFKTNAFNIGGTLGANYQTGPYIVGFEGDIDWSNLSGTSSSAACVGISNGGLAAGATCTTKQDYLGTARARIGYAFDRVFVFGTAGAAFGNEKAVVNTPGAGSITNAIPTQIGWTVGGGVEYAFTEAISVKADYLFVQLGTAACPTAIGCSTILLPLPNNTTPHGTLSLSESLVRLGVNYRFNW
jgi:outer membrane immunogenic protein